MTREVMQQVGARMDARANRESKSEKPVNGEHAQLLLKETRKRRERLHGLAARFAAFDAELQELRQVLDEVSRRVLRTHAKLRELSAAESRAERELVAYLSDV